MDVLSIFRDFRANQKSFEACVGIYGLLTLRKVVTDAHQGPQIFTYDDQFKEYASMLKRFQVADASVQSGQFKVQENAGDFDLYVSQTGLEGFGAGPLAWVLIIAGIGAGYAAFKTGYEWLRQKGREEETKYQAWASTLPADVRADVSKMDEHARAEAAAPGIFAQLRDLGKTSLDVAVLIGIIAGVVLLFKLLGAIEEEKREE